MLYESVEACELSNADCNLLPVGELPIYIDPLTLIQELIVLWRQVRQSEVAEEVSCTKNERQFAFL